jgi:hypothetical protein
VETDLRLLVDIGDIFSGVLEGGFLYPLAGLDDVVTGTAAEPAWTLQARLHVKF